LTRIKIVVEGQTEESFVQRVLAPTLWLREIYLTPIILGVPGHKGGNVNYARVKKDVLLHLRQDPTAYCSYPSEQRTCCAAWLGVELE